MFLLSVFTCGPSKIDDSMVRILYGVFTALTLGGILLLACLRTPHSERLEKGRLSQLELFKSTLRLCSTTPIALLMVTSAYSGLELSFLSAIYPSCIGFTHQLSSDTRIVVGLNAITQGLGQISGGFLFGILGSKTSWLGRDKIVIFSTTVFLAVFLVVYLIFPSSGPLYPNDDVGMFRPQVWIVLLCGYLLGLCDSSLNTQIFSFLITRYSNQIAQAFSLNKFFQHFATCLVFFYASHLNLEIQLLMLAMGTIIGCVCFCFAERLARANERWLYSTKEVIQD